MAYPTVLPIPTREGYAKRPSYDVPRFKMDDGVYRSQNVPGAVPYSYSLTWNLTYDQASFFEAWLEYDVIRNGTSMEIPLAGQTITVFPKTGMPSWKPNGSKWMVSLDVQEIRTGAPLPARGGSLPIWPVSLPMFERDGFSLSAPDYVQNSDIENGKNEQRARFYQKTTTYGGTLIMDLDQRNAFWEFWHTTLLGGSRRFIAPFANSKSQEMLKAKLAKPPEESANGAWFNIALVLDTMAAPMLTYDEYRAYQHFVNTYADNYVVDGYAGYWEF